MARSKDSFNKREREKKRLKKKKEKKERKEQRKLEGSTTPEFMYQDENGNLTATPPDPAKKSKIDIEEIEISVPKQVKSDQPDFVKNGTVKFFNTDKGYGFIIEEMTQISYFVHIDNLIDPIKDNSKVNFEVGTGPRGPIAIKVKLN